MADRNARLWRQQQSVPKARLQASTFGPGAPAGAIANGDQQAMERVRMRSRRDDIFVGEARGRGRSV